VASFKGIRSPFALLLTGRELKIGSTIALRGIMAEQKKEEKKIEKKPSAVKRALQSEKNRLRNRSFRSTVVTAIRSFEEGLTAKEEAPKMEAKLREIYSLMDKGVKHGIYKPQKAARTKSRLSARI
jgi:small subunit ribosomal protein S20